MKDTTPKKPRTHVRMFKDRFAVLVETDRKLQTIRPPTKRERDTPVVGDLIDCRAWVGVPYRAGSTKRKLHAEPRRITFVYDCEISAVGIRVWYLDAQLPPIGLDEFAQADGFRDWADMRDWFRETHGLPFNGVLIRWEAKR